MRPFLNTIGLLLLAQPSLAASISQVSIEDMLREASSIAEVVILKGSRFIKNENNMIWTCQTAKTIYSIKGKLLPEFGLCFMGGKSSSREVFVDGITIPPEGSRLILALDTQEGRLSATPVYGWDQGIFKIASTLEGDEIVLTAANETMYYINSEPLKEFSQILSNGSAFGVQTLPSVNHQEPIQLSSFKAILRQGGKNER